MPNTGTDFEERLRNRLERVGCHVSKIHDHRYFGDESEGAEGEATRFTPRAPYDFDVLRRATDDREPRTMELWYAYSIECKTVLGDRFSFSLVSKDQRKGLLRRPAGCPGLVVIEMRSHKRCFFMRIKRFLAAEKSIGKKSLNLMDLETFAVELPLDTRPRETRAYYDVGPLLEGERPGETTLPTVPVSTLPTWKGKR